MNCRTLADAQFLHDERHIFRDDLALREDNGDVEREGSGEGLRGQRRSAGV